MSTPNLFGDPPPPSDCTKGHDWQKGEKVWEGETHVRLVYICGRCGEVRGRA